MAAMGLWVSRSLRFASRVPRTTMTRRCVSSLHISECSNKVEPRELDVQLWQQTTLKPKRWVDKFPEALTGGVQILNAKVIRVKSKKCAIDEQDQIDLYGRIDAYDRSAYAIRSRCEFIPIYNRDRDNCERVKLGEPIAITGPPRGIFMDDRHFFVQTTLDLYAKGKKMCEGVQLVKYSLEWQDYSYDDICIETIETTNATVQISAAVMSVAVEATVEIGCTENRSGILKRVVAYISGDKIPDLRTYEIVLFDTKATKEQMSPNPDGTVQLWCSTLAVPVEGEMLLEIDIGSDDGNPDVKEFTFPVKLLGQDCIKFQATSAMVLLNISWSSMHKVYRPLRPGFPECPY